MEKLNLVALENGIHLCEGSGKTIESIVEFDMTEQVIMQAVSYLHQTSTTSTEVGVDNKLFKVTVTQVL